MVAFDPGESLGAVGDSPECRQAIAERLDDLRLALAASPLVDPVRVVGGRVAAGQRERGDAPERMVSSVVRDDGFLGS